MKLKLMLMLRVNCLAMSRDRLLSDARPLNISQGYPTLLAIFEQSILGCGLWRPERLL